jgi:hypothetical protein
MQTYLMNLLITELFYCSSKKLTLLNFFFGSAHGSTDKQETIKEVLHSKMEHDK